MRSNFRKIAGFVLTVLLLRSPVAQAQKQYKIPDGLTPVKKWKDGYSAKQAGQFRAQYDESSLPEMADVGTYAMARLSEVLRTAVIHRRGSIAKLKKSSMPEVAKVTATTALGTMALRKAIDDPRSRMRAIAVVHKGELVFEEYVGIRPWDKHVWASSSKTISGLLVHILAKEGRIDLDAPVSKYLKDFKGTAWDKVTVADALHQRSGLDITEDSFAKPGHPMGAFYSTAFAGRDTKVKRSLREIVKGVKKAREPGKLFEYSSINTQICGFIVEAVTGKPWNEVATEKIWDKVGMEGDALIALSPFAEPEAFGVFASRLRDMARFGMLFTPSWKVVAKQRVVSKDYFEKVYAAAKGVGYGSYMGKRLTKDFGMKNLSASYQWDAVFPDGDVYKSGRSGQMLYVSPKTDTVVVWFSSTYKSEPWLHAYARNIVNSLFRKRKQ